MKRITAIGLCLLTLIGGLAKLVSRAAESVGIGRAQDSAVVRDDRPLFVSFSELEPGDRLPIVTISPDAGVAGGTILATAASGYVAPVPNSPVEPPAFRRASFFE